MVAIELACRKHSDARFISQYEIIEQRAPRTTREQHWTVGPSAALVSRF